MSEWWLVFSWGGPVGLGIFLVCLGLMVYLLSKADAISKRTKAQTRDSEQSGRTLRS